MFSSVTWKQLNLKEVCFVMPAKLANAWNLHILGKNVGLLNASFRECNGSLVKQSCLSFHMFFKDAISFFEVFSNSFGLVGEYHNFSPTVQCFEIWALAAVLKWWETFSSFFLSLFQSIKYLFGKAVVLFSQVWLPPLWTDWWSAVSAGFFHFDQALWETLLVTSKVFLLDFYISCSKRLEFPWIKKRFWNYRQKAYSQQSICAPLGCNCLSGMIAPLYKLWWFAKRSERGQGT